MTTKRKADARVAFITGGASGIGLATAELLLGSGWKVAIVDVDAKALEAVRETHSQTKGVHFGVLDVTSESAVDAAVGAAAKALGPIDGVLNSAGIARDIPALETPVDVFRKVLDVNVTGSFLVARAAARLMKERHAKTGVGGAIVNVASIAGLRGSKGRVAYGTSKGAVVTMTQVLANDLARYGIRVNAVAPGPIDTPMVKTLHSPADRALWMRYVPLNRYAVPHEVATAIEFLLDGTRSSYVTGEVLAVDGGFRGAGIIPDRS